MKSASRLWVACLSALVAAACQAPGAPPVIPPTGPAPEGCGPDFPADAPLVEASPAKAPANPSTGKGRPFEFAVSVPVNRGIGASGTWVDFDDGWSSLALRIRSEGAKSLSMHFAQAVLPARTQLWLCSADGRVRQGPYREAVGGELWTAVVPGAEARLEVIVPTIDKAKLTATIADVSAGYR